MMRQGHILFAALLCAGLAVAGCARQISPDVHTGRAAGETMRTSRGVIENVRIVQIQEYDTLEGNGAGRFIGGIAGGFAGARFGDGIGQVLAGIGGALAGAFIGALAEQEIKRQPAIEYIVRTDGGELLTIVQGIHPRLSVGQQVYLQEGVRGRGRVIPAG